MKKIVWTVFWKSEDDSGSLTFDNAKTARLFKAKKYLDYPQVWIEQEMRTARTK